MAYIYPTPGVSPDQYGRVDQGVDLTLAGDFLSIGNGRVVVSNVSDPGWRGGGYIAVQLADGPRSGWVFYVAEGITPYRAVGEHVAAGWGICRRRPNPYNQIFGNIETGWAMPSSPSTPLAHYHYTEGVSTSEGRDYLGFLTGLFSGAPTVATPQGQPTGSVDLSPIQDALLASSMYAVMGPEVDKAAARAHHAYTVSHDTWYRIRGLSTFDKKGGH